MILAAPNRDIPFKALWGQAKLSEQGVWHMQLINKQGSYPFAIEKLIKQRIIRTFETSFYGHR